MALVNRTFGQHFHPAVRPLLGGYGPMLTASAGGALLAVRRTTMTQRPERRDAGSSTSAQTIAVLLAVLGLSVLVAISLMQWLESAA